MLESLVEIGGSVLAENDILVALIKKVPAIKSKKQQHICKFVFNTENNEFKVDVNEEIDDDSSIKYLHVGGVDGPRSPQWYVTSTNSSYILSELFNNLLNLSYSIDTGILNKIEKILAQFYVSIEPELTNDKKYSYFLDIEKLGIDDTPMDELKKEAADSDKPGKKLLESVQKRFNSWLQDKYEIKTNQIGLYTVIIDYEPLAFCESYRQAVLESKKPKTYAVCHGNKLRPLECNICGSKDNVPADLNRMKIKYFTTNQVIFASNMKEYEKDFNLCSSCLEKLQAGEVFIQGNLSTRIAGFDVYIVPHLIYGQALDAKTIKNLGQKLLVTVNMSKAISSIDDFRDRVQQLKDFDNIYYLIDFVFYRSSMAATKILRLIKDVRPSFFELLETSSAQLQKTADRHFGERYQYRGGLEQVYYLTPIRLKQGNASSFRDLLNLYDALFTGRLINKRHLLKNLSECFSICFYEKEGFNIKRKSEYINYLVLDGIFLMEFYKKMGCLKGGGNMNYTGLNLNENIINFMQDMQYEEQQAALFLLGYLVGQVGNAQYRRPGANGAEGTYKPVLNKINFNGIDKSKLIRLRADIFNKLRQEKVLVYNEKVFAECTCLMDKNINHWEMNKDENLFYLLSGYAFATTAPIKKKENN